MKSFTQFINESKAGFGVGDEVELVKPQGNVRYGRLEGFNMAKGANIQPIPGMGMMPVGKVESYTVSVVTDVETKGASARADRRTVVVPVGGLKKVRFSDVYNAAQKSAPVGGGMPKGKPFTGTMPEILKHIRSQRVDTWSIKVGRNVYGIVYDDASRKYALVVDGQTKRNKFKYMNDFYNYINDKVVTDKTAKYDIVVN